MARDIYHYAVKEALLKDGWTITHDPFPLNITNFNMEIDLAAEQIFSAERDKESILVEVKSFLNKSKLTDFYAAKGQYDMYRLGMEIENLDRKLYLAIDEITYKTFFCRDFIRLAVEKGNINILVFDNELKEITTWITH